MKLEELGYIDLWKYNAQKSQTDILGFITQELVSD